MHRERGGAQVTKPANGNLAITMNKDHEDQKIEEKNKNKIHQQNGYS